MKKIIFYICSTLFILSGCTTNDIKVLKKENPTNLKSNSTPLDNKFKKFKDDFISHLPNITSRTSLPLNKITKTFITRFGGGIQSITESTIESDNYCTLKYSGRISKENIPSFLSGAFFLVKSGCKNTLVQLESPGGEIITGLQMGLLINYYGWDTSNIEKTSASKIKLAGCLSSCGLAFMAGKKRYAINGNESLVGFHQAGKLGLASKKECISNPQDPLNSLIYSYLEDLIQKENAAILFNYLITQSCLGPINSNYQSENIKTIIFNHRAIELH